MFSFGNYIYESFGRRESSPMEQPMYGLLIVLIINIIITLLVGMFLWNGVLVKLFPGVNRATSIWQLVGLQILLHMLFPKM